MLDSFSSSILTSSLLKYNRYLGDTESLSFIIYSNDLSYKLKRFRHGLSLAQDASRPALRSGVQESSIISSTLYFM